jgi:hypothetical protein
MSDRIIKPNEVRYYSFELQL